MHEVALNWEQDSTLWKILSRWVEFVMGEQEVDWYFRYEDEDIVYVFETEIHANLFRKLWTKRVLTMSFDTWKQFCISESECAKVEEYWAKKPWTPETVLLNFPQVPKGVVKGYRRKYVRDFESWFFEKDVDAVLFYMEHHRGKSYN